MATPIGNLEDITLRALRILREVALIAAEDTRRTRKLLAHHGIPARVLSVHEHNELVRAPELIARLLAGESIALVSDAGTPGLSDPGVELVRQAVEGGIPVIALPGPSAFVTALVASGLPTEPVTFLGFLPPAPGERRRTLEAYRAVAHTLVIYEAPHRLLKTLQALVAAWGDRKIAVARELTKIHEELFRGTIAEAIGHFTQQRPLGEFTLVVAGATARGAAAAGEPEAAGRVTAGAAAGSGRVGAAAPDPQAEEAARALLTTALKEGVAPFEAVRRAAQATGLRRNAVYRIWLSLKQGAAR